jgi:hypothetical protein
MWAEREMRVAKSDQTQIALAPDRGWLTLKQASQLSGSPIDTLRRMIRIGELHAFTIERNGKTKFRILRSALIDAGLLAIQPPPGQNATVDVLALMRDQNARIARLEDQRSQLAGQLGIALERLRSIDSRLAHLETPEEDILGESVPMTEAAAVPPTPIATIPETTLLNRPSVRLVRTSIARVAEVAATRPWRRGRT